MTENSELALAGDQEFRSYIKMKNSNSNKLEIIKQKGVGKYFGECETNSEEINKYELYVEICSAGEDRYFVNLFSNPEIAFFQTSLYDGNNKRKAEKIFSLAVERDREIKKQNLENKFFIGN